MLEPDWSLESFRMDADMHLGARLEVHQRKAMKWLGITSALEATRTQMCIMYIYIRETMFQTLLLFEETFQA